MQIVDNVALITGGGSGLGAATARRLAAHGAKVAVLDMREEQAARVASEIGGLAVTADVTDTAQVEAAFETVQSELGAPRFVVSCAGIGTAARILPRDGGLSVDIFERTIKVNLIGTYIVMSVAARRMAAAEPLDKDGSRGVIINTASLAYEDGQIGQCAYSASKGGVASLTLPAARELARFGIRVVTIAPGIFETEMSKGLTDEIKAELLRSIPFPGRLGDADDYARLAQQIIENVMLNGTTIRLDGGARMPAK